MIQAGVDYVARQGGGTVRLLPGTYRMRNSVFLQSKVRLLGSGADTVLFKEPSVTTKLIVDGDHWDQEVTVADPKGFQVGDGVRLASKDPYNKGINLAQRTVIATSGNRLKLDSRLHQRFYPGCDAQIATNFALLKCTNVADVIIENLAIDGNKAHNEMVDKGMFDDGSIRMDDSNRITIRGVTVHDFYCDGIVWGISHDVVVENCHLVRRRPIRPSPRFGVATFDRPRQPRAAQRRRASTSAGCAARAVRKERDRGLRAMASRSVMPIRTTSSATTTSAEAARAASSSVATMAATSRFGPHRNRIERNRIIDSGDDKGVAIRLQRRHGFRHHRRRTNFGKRAGRPRASASSFRPNAATFAASTTRSKALPPRSRICEQA